METGELRAWPAPTNFQTDLPDLAARFVARGGAPEFAAQLALEIILNEIVEQGCLATGASGVAIALEKNNELECRATTGLTAPELGAPLDTGQGLSGECIRTREVQICNDTETDSRVDARASRELGVRSVIVLPLVRGTELLGVLEAFSTKRGAFGERDQRTLVALTRRVLQNIEHASRWSAAAREKIAAKAVQVDASEIDRAKVEEGKTEAPRIEEAREATGIEKVAAEEATAEQAAANEVKTSESLKANALENVASDLAANGVTANDEGEQQTHFHFSPDALKGRIAQETVAAGTAPNAVGRDETESERKISDLPQAEGAESKQDESYQGKSQVTSQVRSNEVRSNQVRSNQVRSNQVRSSEVRSYQPASYGVDPEQVKSRVDEAYAGESADVGHGHAGSAEVLMSEINSRVPPSRVISLLTAVMGGVICLTAVGLTLRVAQRFGWIDVGSHARAGVLTADAANSAASQPGSASVAGNSNLSSGASGQVPVKTASANTASSSRSNAGSGSSTTNGKALPPGSLMVSDNGKEVFRMTPIFSDNQSGNQANTPPSAQQDTQAGASGASANTGVEQAAAIEPEKVASEPVVHLSSSAAEEGLLVRVEPEYPEAARQQKIQGAVVLDVRVHRDGTVQQVTLVSGDSVLANSAIAAVNQWQFKPHSVNGQTVATQTRVTLNFRLSR
jgi:TonB family protein